jgi:hypothetical protein
VFETCGSKLTRNRLEIGDSVKNYNNYTIHTMTPMFHPMDTFHMSTKTRRKDHIYCAGLIPTPNFVSMGDVIKFYHFESQTVIKHWCINIILVFLTNCSILFILVFLLFFITLEMPWKSWFSLFFAKCVRQVLLWNSCRTIFAYLDYVKSRDWR